MICLQDFFLEMLILFCVYVILSLFLISPNLAKKLSVTRPQDPPYYSTCWTQSANPTNDFILLYKHIF